MKASTLILPSATLQLATALSLLEPRNGAASVLHMETQRKQVSNPLLRDRLRKRQSTLQASLDNEQTLYFVNVTLGSPAQDLRLDIDTGSSDLWANSPNSEICQEQGGFCDESRTYDSNSSSTYTYVNSDFYIKYADGTFARGDYATDTLSIGGTDISDMQFGIGYNSTSQNGILGVGYESNEVQLQYTGRTYRNLPAQLVERNVIQSNAYSLWLNDLDSNTGSILFGGVDTDKYEGSLSTLPIIQEDDSYREFIIALTGLSAGGSSIFDSNDDPVPVLLDSGSSLSYVPNNYATSIFNTFNADYRESQGAAVVDCSLADDSRTVDFVFSGVKISVSLSELVVVAAVQRGTPTCILGIAPAGDSTSVLGDTFLRSAYVVYDLDNNQISLASTTFNATSSNVREIGTGTSAVPDASLVANAVSSAAVSSGGARNGGIPSDVSGAASSSVMDRQGLSGVLVVSAIVTAAVTLGFGLVL